MCRETGVDFHMFLLVAALLRSEVFLGFKPVVRANVSPAVRRDSKCKNSAAFEECVTKGVRRVAGRL